MLVGHSRGGEGANRALSLARPADPFRVVGQVLIGPTNFARQSAARTPTVTILPACDGDVSDLQGQSFTDVAATVVDDPAVHSSVLIPGTNHNFFNTEWTPAMSVGQCAVDDGSWVRGCRRGDDGRLTAAQQRAMGLAYITGAAAWFTGQPPGVEQISGRTLGHVAPLAKLRPTLARTRSAASGRGMDLSTSTVTTRGLMMGRPARARPARWLPRGSLHQRRAAALQPHWPSPWDPVAERPDVTRLAWDNPGGSGGNLALASPRDLSGASAIDLRVVVPAILASA